MAVIRIELLEDCDMNSGRVMNTYFADDVFFDGFGLPYIPSWIIRNSLLKSVQDAEDLKSMIEKGKLVLDDGVIADHESMRQAILSDRFGKVLLSNPQAVLNDSGLVRIKEISSTNGEEYIRVLAKGDVFESYFDISEDYYERFVALVEKCDHLFVGHNVCVHLSVDDNWNRPLYQTDLPIADVKEGNCRLEYNLYVLSRITTLDHINSEYDAEAFLRGDQIKEALKNRRKFKELFSLPNDVKCSFAYIEVDGKRGMPIPASYATKKQDKNDLRDLCSLGRRSDDFDQIKGMGTLFISDPDAVETSSRRVRMEQGIFQYLENDGLKNCSYTAIAAGQTFRGFIDGESEKISMIAEALNKNGYICIGDLSDMGFGSAYLEVRSVNPLRKKEAVTAKEINVLLLSPTRLYRNGFYEASAQNVKEAVEQKLLGKVQLDIIRSSAKPCSIAVYNKAWGESEAVEYAISSGAVYRMRSVNGEAFDISSLVGNIFLGGHNDEGYGEALILPSEDHYYRTISYGEYEEKDFPLTYKCSPVPGRKLMKLLYQANADTVAAYIGSASAEKYVDEQFMPGLLKDILSVMNDDFDLEEVFVAYMDALKKTGINVLRRKKHD